MRSRGRRWRRVREVRYWGTIEWCFVALAGRGGVSPPVRSPVGVCTGGGTPPLRGPTERSGGADELPVRQDRRLDALREVVRVGQLAQHAVGFRPEPRGLTA